MASIGPFTMSFNPLNEQIEFECAGAPVFTPEPDPGTPGVPGPPLTSPANAALELPPTRTTAKSAAVSTDFGCVIGPFPSVEFPRGRIRGLARIMASLAPPVAPRSLEPPIRGMDDPHVRTDRATDTTSWGRRRPLASFPS